MTNNLESNQTQTTTNESSTSSSTPNNINSTSNSPISRDISPKPYSDWILNETSCCWESPVPYPNDGKNYYWDENNHTWVLMN